MRWLALLLLALNLGYISWHLDQDAQRARANASQSLSVPVGVPGLKLVRELPAPPEVVGKLEAELDFEPEAEAVNDPGLQPVSGAAAEVQAGTGAAPGELVSLLPEVQTRDSAPGPERFTCFSYGPLPEERHAVWLTDWFRARMIRARQRTSVDPNRSLFWIYLAPQPSREQAASVVQTLQAKGVRDYRLIDRGGLANAVSLGLYSTQQAVNDRLKQLRDRGFQPVVVPYSNVQRIHWVDVRIPEGDPALQDMYSGFPARYGSVPVDCGQIALDQPAP
jgi:hypothetical protein